MPIKKYFCYVFLISLLFTQSNLVVHIPIIGDIDMGLPYFIERGIQRAEMDSSKLIIFEIDTFGGRVDAATKIKDLILGTDIPTIAFINRRAISAGALISLSCDKIFMTDGATIGAATAVDSKGEKASEKVISYMREEMASTAEANGRSREIAEAMVDESIKINYMIGVDSDTIKSNLIKGFDEGKLITLSTVNAIKLGIADNQHEKIKEIINSEGYFDYDKISLEETWTEKLVRFLTNPNVAPLLMSLGMLGLFFEVKSPGFGVPGLLGLLFLGLFFGAHLLVGLADFSELILLALGLVFIIIEIIIIPGFGVFGLSGVCMILYSLYSMLIGEYPSPREIELAYRSLILALMSTFILSIVIFKLLVRSDFYKSLVPIQSQLKKDGYSISKNFEEMIGKEGITQTDLRPSGKIEIDSISYQAISQGEYIDKNTEITIISTDENQLVVKKT